MDQYVLALDQGTTSSRAIVFDREGNVVSLAQEEFPQLLPAPGIVEHDPEAIWQSQMHVAEQALEQARLAANQIVAIGIANQRETTILWERDSGRPVHNALVWQSRISTPICERLRREGHEARFRETTGLLIDPYFSATKIVYLLEQDPQLRRQAERGEVLFGTVDSFLIWRLTGGRRHVTDASNASRTLMLNLRTLDWDDDLLEILGVPRAMLPEVVDCSGQLGETNLLGHPLPIAGCAGDQQAATFGQACFQPGSAKNTYGTGCFLLLNTGHEPVGMSSDLLATVGWKLGDEVTYCLEGAVFVGGAVVQWLRDGLGIIKQSSDVESLVRQTRDSGGVYFVPAFVGLGAPHWDPYARGTIVGLTRGTTAAQIALAALESMAFQSRDVLRAMETVSGVRLERLKVDGGACVNDRLMQFQANVLGVPVVRPAVPETTALGVAYLAGLAVGYWDGLDDVGRNWQVQQEFQPEMSEAERDERCRRWEAAVTRSLGWEQPAEGK
jgi:glycerol kinase